MNVERLLANVTRGLTTAGITILSASICSRLFLVISACDTPERGGWFGAMAASAWLTILWVIVAMVFLSICQDKTGALFRIVFVMNAMVTLLLFAEFCFSG